MLSAGGISISRGAAFRTQIVKKSWRAASQSPRGWMVNPRFRIGLRKLQQDAFRTIAKVEKSIKGEGVLQFHRCGKRGKNELVWQTAAPCCAGPCNAAVSCRGASGRRETMSLVPTLRGCEL